MIGGLDGATARRPPTSLDQLAKGGSMRPRSETSPEQGPLTLWASETTYATLGEVVEAARAALDTDVLEFLDSGAGDELTLRRNREAFARWSFRPRVMS